MKNINTIPRIDPAATPACYSTRVLKALRRIIRAVDIHSKRLQQEYKITGPQMICLHSLLGNEVMTQSELANQVDLSMSTVTGIIDRLEAKNWVTRTRGSNDRRKVFIALTDSGRQRATSVPTLLQQQLTTALAALPESEQTTITESLEHIVKLMDATQLDASRNLFPTENIPENGEHTA